MKKIVFGIVLLGIFLMIIFNADLRALSGEIYQVDTSKNAVQVRDWTSKFLSIPISKGTHTIRLEKADSGNIGWNPIVFFQQNDGLPPGSPYYCFTLNGIGDSKTITFTSDGALHAGIFDSFVPDNHGTITIVIE